jgi:hypothetical protein
MNGVGMSRHGSPCSKFLPTSIIVWHVRIRPARSVVLKRTDVLHQLKKEEERNEHAAQLGSRSNYLVCRWYSWRVTVGAMARTRCAFKSMDLLPLLSSPHERGFGGGAVVTPAEQPVARPGASPQRTHREHFQHCVACAAAKTRQGE